MPNYIERLNYYEREHLRSFDFTAEQSYHLEMRRRLNLALHLWGIVEGLDVLKSDPIPGVPDQFYISAGMAIDAYGREIVLFSNYALSSDDLDTNQITGATGSYSLFIAYSRELTTPPSSGYGVCDIADQYTRQRESFKVVISRDPDPGPTNEPTATSELSDDPKDKPWLVRLGTILVGPDPITNRSSIVKATPAESRAYIGLRAQRVVTPADATKSFEILRQNTALAPPTSLSLQANLFAEQNAIIGSDFEVIITPPPTPTPPAVFPNPTGNMKIASDLFLQGNFYANVANKWLTLAEQIKPLSPEILVGPPHPITIASPGNGTEKFTLPTTKKFSSAKITASIAAVQWNDLQTRFDIFLAVGATAKLSYQIIDARAGHSATGPNFCDIEIDWAVAPTALLGPAGSQTFASAIFAMSVAYVVVCNP